VVFTLTEYARSGRILIEALASLVAFYIFFRHTASTMLPSYFFGTAGLLLVVLTFYTTTSIMGLGDRPQGYMVLVRRIGRSGYLLGLYVAALLVELGVYGIICLAVVLLNPIPTMGLRDWLLGTLPLILNVMLLGSLLTLLAPIVLTSGWRLLILAIVAIAFSGNLISGQPSSSLWQPLATALNILRTIFSTPLLPAFSGFALSVSRDYSGFGVAILIAQLSLTLSMLALASYAFARRELIFNS